jgi:hypothetical protein
MPLTTPFQSRETAMQGDYVRLFCTFTVNGVLRNPMTQPQIKIVTNDYYQESTSSSSVSSGDTIETSNSTSSSSMAAHGNGWGPFYAVQLHTGIWYVDWFVPENAVLGDYFDIWYFQFEPSAPFEQKTFKFEVHEADTFLNFSPNPEVNKMGDIAVSLVNGLKNNLIGEACNIPVYWEQGMPVNPTKLNFAFNNWRKDKQVFLRKNNNLISNFTPDFNGSIMLERVIDPEDAFYAHYYFSYFTDEELLNMLNEALWVMNATPPASMTYSSIANIPFVWRGGVIMYASMQALRKVIFGFNWQERAIIFGEKPEDAQRFIDNCKTLYSDYSTLWNEIRKDTKKILPAISINVTPEYTMPGGRCLSSDACISCKIDGKYEQKTIAEMYKLSSDKTVEVMSMIKNRIGFAQVSKVWKSGKKPTFVLMAGGYSLRVSREHLVFVPEANDYWPTYALRKGMNILVDHQGVLREVPLEETPVFFGEEDVYDIEVPASKNLLTNGIVTHNSRWFRYMYKGST